MCGAGVGGTDIIHMFPVSCFKLMSRCVCMIYAVLGISAAHGPACTKRPWVKAFSFSPLYALHTLASLPRAQMEPSPQGSKPCSGTSWDRESWTSLAVESNSPGVLEPLECEPRVGEGFPNAWEYFPQT